MSNKFKIGIIDLECNNLFSIYNSFLKAGNNTKIITSNEKKYNYDFLIIPGVGSFKTGMKIIKKYHYDEKINNYLQKRNSFIYGICLGMQLLFENSSEHGLTKGLGFIKGKICNFNDKKLKLKTNIGWSKIKMKKISKNKIINFNKEYFYFIHSYYAEPKIKSEILAKSLHKNFNFCSAVLKKNILGTQFHPEKSGIAGIKFLKNLKNFK